MITAGVDEVGRGSLAGPVIAAAVIFKQPLHGLKDSKLLSPKKRIQLAEIIKAAALCFAYGRAEIDEIDRLNIHNASLLAMKRAIENLTVVPQKVLVDGKFSPAIDMESEAIVKGDSLIPEISAASILAKVYRDQEMEDLSKIYPEYGFEVHKGYPTALHKQQLQKYGVSKIHRKSFVSIANLKKINSETAAF